MHAPVDPPPPPRCARRRRGYKNVISQGVKLNLKGVDCALMMETSGHGALRENHYLDDGAYLATKVGAIRAACVHALHMCMQGSASRGADSLQRSVHGDAHAKQYVAASGSPFW